MTTTNEDTLLVGGVGLVSLANLFTDEKMKFGVIALGLIVIGLRGYLKSKRQQKDKTPAAPAPAPTNATK